MAKFGNIHVRSLSTFLILLLAARSVLAQTTASSPPLDPEKLTALGSELYLGSGATGMVLLVVHENQVLFRGYGETAPDSHQTPTQASMLRLCSLTKIFTADILAKLIADGTVKLDDPLQRFAPRHVKVPTRVTSIKLVDLATHTSGLPRELGNAPRDTPHFTYPDYQTRWHWLPNQRLRSEPGKAALYSNIAFDLLGDALQSASHQPYASLLAERTLNPLKMQHTTFFPTTEQCRLLLAGIKDEGPCTSTEQTAGSSGLYSNAIDMATWLKYLLGTSDPAIPAQAPSAQAIYLKPADLVSEKGLEHAGMPTGVGLGWIHILPVDEDSHIIEKTGGGAGYSTYIAINHSRHIALFLAATDGAANTRGVTDTHLNLFNAANKLLLDIAGLPPLPPPPPPPTRRRVRRRPIAKR